MRDSPLILKVAWGKGRKELMSLWQPRKNNSAHYPQKREKPRGNGASEERKK